MIAVLVFTHNKIDACFGDCLLYWKEMTYDSVFNRCGTSRWNTILVNWKQQIRMD